MEIYKITGNDALKSVYKAFVNMYGIITEWDYIGCGTDYDAYMYVAKHGRLVNENDKISTLANC